MNINNSRSINRILFMVLMVGESSTVHALEDIPLSPRSPAASSSAITASCPGPSPRSSVTSPRRHSHTSMSSMVSAFPDHLYLEKKRFTFHSLKSILKIALYNPLDDMYRAQFIRQEDKTTAIIYESATLDLGALSSIKDYYKGYLFENFIKRADNDRMIVYPFAIVNEKCAIVHLFWLIHTGMPSIIKSYDDSGRCFRNFKRVFSERDIFPGRLFDLKQKVRSFHGLPDISETPLKQSRAHTKRRNKSFSSSPEFSSPYFAPTMTLASQGMTTSMKKARSSPHLPGSLTNSDPTSARVQDFLTVPQIESYYAPSIAINLPNTAPRLVSYTISIVPRLMEDGSSDKSADK